MNSKIGGILSVNKVLVSENRQQSKSGSSAVVSGRAGDSSAQEDSVMLTDAAQTMVSMAREMDAAPVIDRARIEEIKTAISNGSFRPNPEKIASKLMELEISLSD